MNTRAIGLMDKIMEPAPSWTAALGKPLAVLQVMPIAISWKLNTKIPDTHPGVVSFIQALRTNPPPFPTEDLKIGAAGFCWGGKHVFMLAHDDPANHIKRHESQTKSQDPERLIDGAFTAHPSLLEMPADAEALKIPTSVIVGDKDMVLKEQGAKTMKEVFDKKTEHEIHIEPGAKHGFAVRMHPDDKHEMDCAQMAEDQAIKWFTERFR